MIIANHLQVWTRKQTTTFYSDVTKFWTETPVLIIQGRRADNNGLLITVEDRYYLDEILTMTVGFKKPILKEATDYPDAPLGTQV